MKKIRKKKGGYSPFNERPSFQPTEYPKNYAGAAATPYNYNIPLMREIICLQIIFPKTLFLSDGKLFTIYPIKIFVF